MKTGHTLDEILAQLDIKPSQEALDRLIKAADRGTFQQVLEALLAYVQTTEEKADWSD